MGTDIHLYVERKRDDGTWERVRPLPWKCPSCNGLGHYEKRPTEQCYACNGAGVTSKEYDARNYDLFAILANVRNGYGFAGCDTGDGFEARVQRGLPDDLSFPREPPNWEDEDAPYLGDHSFSWLTLAEALTLPYDRTTQKRGTLNSVEFATWNDKRGCPRSYCGGVSGPHVEYVSNEKMMQLLSAGSTPSVRPENVSEYTSFIEATNSKNYFTVVEWTESYRDSVGEAWFNFLEAVKPLGDPERIRFVFGFDS